MEWKFEFFTIWFTVKKRLENWRCIISPNWGESEKEKGVWMVDDSSAFFFILVLLINLLVSILHSFTSLHLFFFLVNMENVTNTV